MDVFGSSDRSFAPRSSSGHDTYFSALEQQLQGIADPLAKMDAASHALGEQLGAAQVGFGEIDDLQEYGLVHRDWTDGRIPTVAGRWRLADFGIGFIADLKRGAPVVIADVRHDRRTADPQVSGAWEQIGARALIDLALIRNGRMVAILFVHHPEPRSWSQVEINLVTGTCERLWDAVERARAEAALQQSRDQLALALDAARMGTFEWDPRSDRIVLTHNSIELFGFAPKDWPRTSAETFRHLHPDDRDQHQDAFREASENGRDWHSEYRVVRPRDGKVIWIEERGRTLVEPGTGHLRFVGVHWDVTARKLAEERLRSAFAIRTVGVLYWNADFRLADMNDAFLQMTGFTREEATGKTWQEFTPPEFHEASWNAVREVTAYGETTPYEKQYFRKDGSRWWGLFAARKVGDQAVEFVLDVTERRQAEAAARELNETLELRVAEEVAARLGAEDALRQSQKMEAIGQLTGGVAHDFNNLLTVICSSAELLQREDLPSERRRRYLAAISETADRAAKLTAQLLAFARRQTLQPEVFSVAESLKSIGDILHSVLGSRIILDTGSECADCFVRADPNWFETALVNLAVNARDAMDGEGRLTITVEATTHVPPVRGHASAKGDFVAVSVADTGCGIPHDRLAQIFEPFYTTKEVGRGTGLGLSQVYGFAKQSGGEIEVHSREGEGATFTLYLPRVPAPETSIDSHHLHSVLRPQGGHVLVVEDNEQVGAFSSQLLQDLGFETTLAPNAKVALELIEECPDRFDAVFSDVVMPGMSGVELAELLRTKKPRLPVILTSGYSHVLVSEGARGFPLIQKPYSVRDLTRVLRDAMEAALEA